MPWFSDPQRDSRDDIRATQKARKYAGDPRSQAEVDYATHLYRVRAALATPRHVLGAGFLVGVAVAGALLLALGVGSFLIVAAFGSAVPAWGPAGPFVVRGPDDSGSSGGSLLDILLPLVTTVAVLGVAGAGIALVTRTRWRRAGVLDTYIDLAPRQAYLLQTVAVWVGVGALMVLAVRWQGDEEMVTGAVVMLTFAGIPLLALLFSAMFPSLGLQVAPAPRPSARSTPPRSRGRSSNVRWRFGSNPTAAAVRPLARRPAPQHRPTRPVGGRSAGSTQRIQRRQTQAIGRLPCQAVSGADGCRRRAQRLCQRRKVATAQRVVGTPRTTAIGAPCAARRRPGVVK